MKYTGESEGEDEEETEYRPESDDAGVFWCPRCGSEMYGDAVRCPTCGDYVTPGHRHASEAMPWWIWVIVIVVALAMLAGVVASFF
jgi:predicted RNA-binding Zn-ribbon protein involved in translation (DUF1610 family)